MPWTQTGNINYHVQLGLPDKGHAIKEHSLDLEPMDLLNGLALGCYQPFLGILIVIILIPDNKNYTCDLPKRPAVEFGYFFLCLSVS